MHANSPANENRSQQVNPKKRRQTSCEEPAKKSEEDINHGAKLISILAELITGYG